MTDILLQQGRAEYAQLLDFSEPRHRAYAERHDLCYLRYDGPLVPSWSGHWDQIALFRALLGQGAERIFWIDADALIVGDTDIRDGLGEADLAMARHPGPPEHWNIGVCCIRNGDRVRELVRAVIERGPGGFPWYQQAVLNERLDGEFADVEVARLGNEWNCTHCLGHFTEVREPVIVAWHSMPGLDARLDAMQRYE